MLKEEFVIPDTVDFKGGELAMEGSWGEAIAERVRKETRKETRKEDRKAYAKGLAHAMKKKRFPRTMAVSLITSAIDIKRKKAEKIVDKVYGPEV